MPNYSIVWERSYCRSIAANHARNHNDQLLRVDTFLLHCLAFCALLALLWDCHTQLIMPKSPYTSCCFASSVKLLFGSGSHPSQSVFIVKPRSKSAVIKYHRALIWFWWFLKVLVFSLFLNFGIIDISSTPGQTDLLNSSEALWEGISELALLTAEFYSFCLQWVCAFDEKPYWMFRDHWGRHYTKKDITRSKKCKNKQTKHLLSQQVMKSEITAKRVT